MIAAWMALVFATPMIPNRLPTAYTWLHGAYAESGLVDAFPAKLPRDARHVQLYHHPSFLQGGMEFQVRAELPADQVQAILDEYRPRSLGDLPQVPGTTYPYDPRTPPNLLDEDTNDWPASYEMIVLRGNAAGQPGHVWNHGDCAGLAVDVERNMVVWWARYW